MTTPKIAVVGTTRAGKSVFITVLAKHLERPRDGARLSPKGGSPKNTYAQIEEWWNELQAGSWLPPTPPGTLIELNWDLVMDDKTIPLQMFDYAGETLTDLFTNRARDAEGAARQYFDQVREVLESASVLLVLLNLESLIEQGVGRATETKGTLVTATTAFLNKIKADQRDCRVCFVFTSYDRYESLIKQRWGSVQAFLEREIPPLYYEVADKNPNVRILPVAAVGETETRIDPQTGNATLYPKAGFKTKGFDQLVRWLVKATSESKADLDVIAEQSRQDEENTQFLKKVLGGWEKVKQSQQPEVINRFLAEAGCAFPHASRPAVGVLASQQKEVIDAATALRDGIVRAAKADKWQQTWRTLKRTAVIVAVLFGGCVVVQTVQDIRKASEAERLKGPLPEKVGNGSWKSSCLPFVGACWECRVAVTAPVLNRGGAGNVTITAAVGDRTESMTRFFNANEQASVTVMVGNLPKHPGDDAFVTIDCRPSN